MGKDDKNIPSPSLYVSTFLLKAKDTYIYEWREYIRYHIWCLYFNVELTKSFVIIMKYRHNEFGQTHVSWSDEYSCNMEKYLLSNQPTH